MAQSIPLNRISATLAWMETFRTVIQANPTGYQLTASQVSTVTSLVTAFRNAFNLAGVEDGVKVNPGAYTQPNRELLYAARQNALDQIRPIVNLIQQNPAITDAAKLAAGIAPKNNGRTPRTLPSAAPVLAIVEYQPLRHILSFYQSDNPSLKRLPDTAETMILYAATSDTPIVNPELLYQVALVERSPFSTPQWNASAGGKTAYYAARWAGTRQQLGNWSAIISATIPAL